MAGTAGNCRISASGTGQARRDLDTSALRIAAPTLTINKGANSLVVQGHFRAGFSIQRAPCGGFGFLICQYRLFQVMFSKTSEVVKVSYSQTKYRNSGLVAGIVLLVLVTVAGIACRRQAKTGEIGKEITVSPLSYTVIRTEWKDALDDSTGQRLPSQKYLLVSVIVKNESDTEVALPLLSLVDASGKESLEQNRGDGVGDWLGLLRSVPAGGQLNGSLLFDVAPGSYKLRITSGGDVERETTALVNLPYQVEAPGAASPQNLPSPIGR